MSAPGIEHRRISALMRGSMEHTAYYAQEMRYHQACYTGHTDDGLRTGMTREGREARRRKRVAGMLRPAPVAARSFWDLVPRWFFGGEGRRIGRKEAGVLHFEIEIEVDLRPFENLFLYAIMFRLV